jgi:hypothetical protein
MRGDGVTTLAGINRTSGVGAMAMTVEARGAMLQVRSAAGLTYQASTSTAEGVFEHFFAAYDKSFVLVNEKEGLSGFAECFALNDGPSYQALSARYGPFREYVVVVRNTSETVLGGLNLITFRLVESGGIGHLLSLNLNYIFVVPSQRRGGVFRTIVSDLPGLALALFKHTNACDIPEEWDALQPSPAVYTFIEQNDPYRMAPQDYVLDTQATGVDQLARIAIWARQGAKIVDFPYVQPALTADQDSDSNLVYAVLGAKGGSLHPELLSQHLQRFFAISVLKGRDPNENAEAHQQLARLAVLKSAGARVALLEMVDLERLPNPGADHGTEAALTLRGLLSP